MRVKDFAPKYYYSLIPMEGKYLKRILYIGVAMPKRFSAGGKMRTSREPTQLHTAANNQLNPYF
jgi:hypothetical protein